MLYRTTNGSRICITQPTHAWVSGQLAQRWGNETFGSVTPYEAVCLGAEQHDIGWLPWEAAPAFNPDTGYPRSFTEIAPEVHTKLWAGAKHLAMPMGRYATLLISLHGTGLYERFTHWKQSPQSVQIVEDFLKQEKEFQQQLVDCLRQDSAYAPYATPEAIAHNQHLIATLDALSLAICMGLTGQRQIEQVPTAIGETTLTLIPISPEQDPEDPTNKPFQLFVEPWCFQSNEVTVVFEGRVLKEKAPNEQTMRDQLANAAWVTLTATLRPLPDSYTSAL
jgi:hypothetical protein